MSDGLKILPTKHFIERLIERKFELSVISLVYMEIAKSTNPHQTLFEVSNGRATITFSLNRARGEVKLVSGWVGNRGKKKILF